MTIEDMINDAIKTLESCSLCESDCDYVSCEESVVDEEQALIIVENIHNTLGPEYSKIEIAQLFNTIYRMYHSEYSDAFTACWLCREELFNGKICNGNCIKNTYKRFMNRLTKTDLIVTVEDL